MSKCVFKTPPLQAFHGEKLSLLKSEHKKSSAELHLNGVAPDLTVEEPQVELQRLPTTETAL